MTSIKLIIICFCLLVSTTTDIYCASKLESEAPDERDRDHIENLLKASHSNTSNEHQTLDQLKAIYKQAIQPMEQAYKFSDISDKLMREGDIDSLPKMTFIGPWSTGKSTMINYLLNLETSSFALPSGASPTTTDFTILRYGNEVRSMDGTVIAIESSYAPLKKFGHGFLNKLHSFNFPNRLLQKVTIVDTPGIIENQKQRERSYPFNDVCKWFLDHSEIIILVFDYTKLDVGVELEKLFTQLKGLESKVRIILNKADVLSTQELMRVYGTLFWGLAPLMNVTEPPRVYVGSFWSKAFSLGSKDNHNFFLKEEVTLLQDVKVDIANWVENKIVALRQHALFVRNHAITVTEYLKALKANIGMLKVFTYKEDVMKNIIEKPENYQILQNILLNNEINVHDLIPLTKYPKFFSTYTIDSFKPLDYYCSMFGTGCHLAAINEAINESLPKLLFEFQTLRYQTEKEEGYCSTEERNCGL